jgi:large subunit ribosomal protein L25
MAHIVTIPASNRPETGTSACRRLRRQGRIPANVYGHEQAPLAISLSGDDVQQLVTSGAHVVDLDIEGQTGKALIREVQWNTFSTRVQHVDFLRVDPNERVRVEVPVHLRGTAPGTLAGGILEQPLHNLHVECLAVDVPDAIEVRTGTLDVGSSIHVRDLTDLPAGVTISEPPDALIVHVVKLGKAALAAAEEAAVPGLTQPELIGREEKKGEEEGD